MSNRFMFGGVYESIIYIIVYLRHRIPDDGPKLWRIYEHLIQQHDDVSIHIEGTRQGQRHPTAMNSSSFNMFVSYRDSSKRKCENFK